MLIWLLLAAIVGSMLTPPAPRPAEAAPEASRAAQAAGETGPDAVVPDAPARRETVRRTAYTRTDSNPDGTFSTFFGTRPLHWKDKATGEWKAYDNVLRPSADPAFGHEKKDSGYKAKFGKAADVDAGKPVLRVEADGASIEISARGAAKAAVSVSGNKIKYAGAYPDADLEYAADNERVKEEIVLR